MNEEDYADLIGDLNVEIERWLSAAAAAQKQRDALLAACRAALEDIDAVGRGDEPALLLHLTGARLANAIRAAEGTS